MSTPRIRTTAETLRAAKIADRLDEVLHLRAWWISSPRPSCQKAWAGLTNPRARVYARPKRHAQIGAEGLSPGDEGIVIGRKLPPTETTPAVIITGNQFPPMTEGIEIHSFTLDDELLRTMDSRKRNQLLGCMHAHNELTFLNRLLLFSDTSVSDGELYCQAQYFVRAWEQTTGDDFVAGKVGATT